MTIAKLKALPSPQLISKTPKSYDEAKGRKRVSDLRKLLERAAIRYVREGKSKSRAERLRDISYDSGIPIGVLEKL